MVVPFVTGFHRPRLLRPRLLFGHLLPDRLVCLLHPPLQRIQFWRSD
jgi:hypothetical protein